MEHALVTLNHLKSCEKKYDVIYMNTPWTKFDVSKLSKLGIKSLVNDKSVLFMWVDTYTAGHASGLMNDWGFKFHSVYQINDVAQYPWMSKPRKTGEEEVKTEELKQDELKVDDVVTQGNTVESMDVVSEKKSVVRRTKKPRAPPVHEPGWWTSSNSGSGRSTTEQLWVAYRGDDESVLDEFRNEKAGKVPFQVINMPEVGKKSRSVSKKVTCMDDSWNIDRPHEFMTTALGLLKPGLNVLEMFGSSTWRDVDSWGVNVPGGFVSAFNKNDGIIGALNKVMRGLKKIQLQTLSSKLNKYLISDSRDEKVQILVDIKDLWGVLVKAVAEMKCDFTYDWGSDDTDLPAEWLVHLVQSVASDNVVDYSGLRKKRKKRKSSSNANRPRHGIAAPMRISEELSTFLKLEPGEKIPRTTAVKLINDYIKEQGIQNPKRKTQLLLDEPLLKLLDPPSDFGIVSYFSICRLLGKHFIKEPKIDANESNKKARVEA